MAAIDAHWSPELVPPMPRSEGQREALYLAMRDGTQIALDVTLPRLRPGEKVPTILRQTRYFRGVELPRGLSWEATRDAFDLVARTRERFVARGYAWVDVDVRGSGVSGGSWPIPWSPEEVRDGAEVVDFVVAKPWSNGRVGSTGISYDGTTAEMLLLNHHPAVRAIAPRFSLFDAYTDVAFPGGVPLSWFTEGWSRFNRLLDDHKFHQAMASLMVVVFDGHAGAPNSKVASTFQKVLKTVGPKVTESVLSFAFARVFRGGRRVDADPKGILRDALIREHEKNGDVHELCGVGQYHDDVPEHRPDLGFKVVSPAGNLERLRASKVPILSYSGWFDGAYAASAIRRFQEVSGAGLILGPWGHGGLLAHAPFEAARPAEFPHDHELLRFFDRHLRDEPAGPDGPPIRYFTLGKGWQSAGSWPPPGVVQEVLSLTEDALAPAGEPLPLSSRALPNRTGFATGPRSRWKGVLAGFVAADYPDFAARTRGELSFDSWVLGWDLIVTGAPTIPLSVTSTEADFALFAYLADVGPDGQVGYVTEGQLRSVHRKEPRTFERGDAIESAGTMQMTWSLLPTSYLFSKGHRVRLIITRGDADNFAPFERGSVSLHLGGEAGSTLTLPVEGLSPVG